VRTHHAYGAPFLFQVTTRTFNSKGWLKLGVNVDEKERVEG